MIDWTRKMWHIYTMEYYAAIKNDEFVSFVGTWINLETIILSKLTQEEKIKHHMFSLRWVSNNDNTWTLGWEGASHTGVCGRGTRGRTVESGSWGGIT